jgi:hypothetical protein
MNKYILIIIVLFLNINMIFGYDIRSIFEYKPKFVKPNKSIARIEISEEDKINGIINCFIQSIQDDNFLTIEKFDKHFVNLLATTIAHELGHYNDYSNIMYTGGYSSVQDSLTRHFEDFQNISIQNKSQFYFRTH